jgi:uncharacterized membrane protein
MMKTKEEKTILALAFIGLLLASYAITLHFAPSTSSFCTYGPSLNCDKVNKSEWATVLGIPVAIFGFIAYLFVFMAVLKRKQIEKMLAFTTEDFWMYTYILVMFMFAFQLYLTFLEAFVIHAYCVVCLGSQLITILLAIFVGKEKLAKKKN